MGNMQIGGPSFFVNQGLSTGSRKVDTLEDTTLFTFGAGMEVEPEEDEPTPPSGPAKAKGKDGKGGKKKWWQILVDVAKTVVKVLFPAWGIVADVAAEGVKNLSGGGNGGGDTNPDSVE